MKYEVIYQVDLPVNKVVNNPADMYKIFKDLGYADKRQEQSILVTLDSLRNVIAIHVVHIGSSNATITCARDIMYKAIMDNASEIILCHNHPSGSLEPSESDFKTATRMYKVGLLHDIKILSNMIISKYGFSIMKPDEKEIEHFKKEIF
jgi:DNA repair protein RadC